MTHDPTALEVERVAKAMFDAWPARAVSPYLAEMFGVPVNTPLTWENIIEGGGNHDGLIRLARAAVAALSTRNEALDEAGGARDNQEESP